MSITGNSSVDQPEGGPRNIPDLSGFPLPAPWATTVGTRILRGVVYSEPGLGERPLELDVHLPSVANPAPYPVVVFVHGGAFLGGTRSWAGPMYDPAALEPFATVARAGLAVVSVDYRLSGEAKWPAQRDDLRAALGWVRRRGGELGLDGDRIGLWGESAGGHLAAAAALAAGDAVAGALRACVPWYPLTDIAAMAADRGGEPTSADSPEGMLLGGAPHEAFDLARDASAVSHVHADAPPFLLLHGDADRSVPHRQSERLRDALASAGVPAELHTYPGSAHVWRDEPDVAADALRRTVDFLRRHLTG